MKQKLQKYLSGEREGFSLIELIIVIAIMAILIGVVALAVIPYLERSRESKDQQTIDTVYSAFQSTIALKQIKKPTDSDKSFTITSTGATASAPFDNAFIDSMAEHMGTTSADIAAATVNKLGSEIAASSGSYTITCTLCTTGEIKVEAGSIKSSNRASSATGSTNTQN